MSDITVNLKNNEVEVHKSNSENWKVTLVDTGMNTLTGGRVKRIQEYIGNEAFLLTYGDGVSNVNIKDLVKFHKKNGAKLTVTAYQPQGKFGSLNISNDNKVESFTEKPAGDNMWINAGYFVCEPEVFDYITHGDETIFEKDPLENLSKDDTLEITLSLEKKEGIFLDMVPSNVKIIEYKVAEDKNIVIRKAKNIINRIVFYLKYNKKFDSSICFATYSIPGMFQTNIASDNRAIWMHGEYLDILRK